MFSSFLFFFCLETKEAKVQGCGFLGYKSLANAKTSELAPLKQQMFLNALTSDLLNATKPNAVASLLCQFIVLVVLSGVQRSRSISI